MAYAAVAFLAISTVLSMKAQKEDSAFESAMADRKAAQVKATGQRGAEETRRQGEQVSSDAMASMAGGGGVTDDPGAIKQLADIEHISDYNQLSALYGADTEVQGIQITDKYQRKQLKTKQASTALSGASKMYGAM